MCFGSGGGGSATQTTRQDLPGWLKPYAQDYVSMSQGLLAPGGQPVGYPYPYQEVAPMTGLQLAGMNAIAGQGAYNPLVNQAQEFQSGMMGQNAIQNPLLQQYYWSAAEPATGQLNYAALRSGGFGGSGHMDQEGRMLSQLASQIYTPAWNQQEQLRQQAAYMSPTLMQAGYYPAQQLMQAGGAGQQQMQNVLNTGYQNLYQQAGWPFDVINRLGQVLGLALGTGGVQTVSMPTTGPFGPYRV